MNIRPKNYAQKLKKSFESYAMKRPTAEGGLGDGKLETFMACLELYLVFTFPKISSLILLSHIKNQQVNHENL